MRPRRRRTETLSDDQRRELLGISLAGLRAAYPTPNRREYPSWWGKFASREQRLEAWKRHRHELLPEWQEHHPGEIHYLERAEAER